MSIRLEDRTILITGGTSGVGLALVRALHPRNNRLVVVARSAAKLEALARDYPGIAVHACDIASREAVEALCDDLARQHPHLSVVIHNAAIQFTPEFLSEDFAFDHIDYEVRTNLLAPAWMTALLLPVLKDYPGEAAFVAMGSGLGLHPKRTSAIYCATKAAIHSLAQSLNYQFKGTNLRFVEAILPLVDTPMTAGRGRGKMAPDDVAKAIIAGIERGKREILIGKARLLPVLSRLSPALTKSIMRRM